MLEHRFKADLGGGDYGWLKARLHSGHRARAQFACGGAYGTRVQHACCAGHAYTRRRSPGRSCAGADRFVDRASVCVLVRGELTWPEPSELARREDIAQQLWRDSAELTGMECD